ncbi:MAG: WbqC family protein [Synergistota bacterium]|nr:WbqC family protein [Synergistota bacterium]
MKQKTVAILQSNYIPWKGNFHMMRLVDEYVLYDDVQFTRRDWRNRNKIKTPTGLRWLTIPVKSVSNHQSKECSQRICDTEISDVFWAEKHWKEIESNYSIAPFWKMYETKLKETYETAAKETLLSMVNYHFLSKLMELLVFSTTITWSMDYSAKGHKTDRLLDILQKAEATDYLSGPLAKDYIENEKFDKAGIALHWMEYGPYPEYQQLYPPFEHGVSVLDMLFMLGKDTPSFIWNNE